MMFQTVQSRLQDVDEALSIWPWHGESGGRTVSAQSSRSGIPAREGPRVRKPELSPQALAHTSAPVQDLSQAVDGSFPWALLTASKALW